MGLGVPKLRALFLETFGHHTASNNGSWLRRKLCEKPDTERGRGRSAAVRKRDQGAAIWTTGTVRNITQVRCHKSLRVLEIAVQFLCLHRYLVRYGRLRRAAIRTCWTSSPCTKQHCMQSYRRKPATG